MSERAAGVVAPVGRPEHPKRIDRKPLIPNLKMQVRPGGSAGRAYARDELLAAHDFVRLNMCHLQLRVAARVTAAVVDLDHIAIRASSFSHRHAAGSDGANLGSKVAAKIQTGMKADFAGEPVDEIAEACSGFRA